MKKRLIDFIYKFIEFFPPRIAEKIKIIGCVIFGDWHFLPPRPIFPFAEEFSMDFADELKKIQLILDNESFDCVLHFIEKCRKESRIYKTISPFKYALIVDHSKIDDYAILPVPANKQLIAARKKYHLKTGGYESLIFQQGVAYLTQEQKNYFNGKIVVDAGSYVGHYAIPLIKNYSFSQLWAFEPSKHSRLIFEKNMKKNHISSKMYRQFPYGLGKEKKVIYYDSEEIDLRLDGKDKCEIVPLDKIAADFNVLDRIGLIKADVEGMGLELLQGASNILKFSRPVLALSAYHCPDELFGQVFFLAKMFPDYRFYFIDMPEKSNFELTLIAIPSELGEFEYRRKKI